MVFGVLWPATIPKRCSSNAPALPQEHSSGNVVLRIAWQLAIPFRSVGLVTSVVPSEVSGGEVCVRRGSVARCGAAVC